MSFVSDKFGKIFVLLVTAWACAVAAAVTSNFTNATPIIKAPAANAADEFPVLVPGGAGVFYPNATNKDAHRSIFDANFRDYDEAYAEDIMSAPTATFIDAVVNNTTGTELDATPLIDSGSPKGNYTAAGSDPTSTAESDAGSIIHFKGAASSVYEQGHRVTGLVAAGFFIAALAFVL